MRADLDLPRTQRWLQAFITSQAGSDEEALRSDATAKVYSGDVASIVTPSARLTALERAGVYRGMYLMRMQEALESDYPVVRDWLGETQFARLVAGYVLDYPSRSYTLNRLGDHLPAYIAELPPFEHQDFLAALARFELTVAQAFDENETPALSLEAISGIPDATWETARFVPIAALRLLAFAYPVDRFKEAYRDGLPYPAPEAAETPIAVYRRAYRVFWLPLETPAFQLLEALASGATLGSAIERTLASGDVDEQALFTWFQDWLRAGLFSAVSLEH